MGNTVITSVNCLFVSALHRLYSNDFFAPFLQSLFTTFDKAHSSIEGDEEALLRVKNLITIFMSLYLFGSVTHSFIFGVISMLMDSFKERDIEILLSLMHNVGLTLRKDSPELLLDLIKEVEKRFTNLET